MFRYALRPTISPVSRNAIVFALSSALLYWVAVSHALAAPQAAARDPQALTLIASSLKALTGGVAVNDVIVQTTATYVAGSDEETGTATLTASGNQQSLLQLNLSGGTREEIRNGPAGAWIGPDGTAHSMVTDNCLNDADWFYPVLTLEALQTDPTLGVQYIGPTVWNGVATVQLQFFHVIPGQTAPVTTEIQNRSVVNLYLDPASMLPLALDFNTHADDNVNLNIPVEIRFGDYRAASGVLIPFRIQKLLQGTLLLDFVAAQAAVNSALPPSTFTIPALPTGGAE